MSDPVITAGGVALGVASGFAPFAGIDYGVVFGAFIGAMFFVTQATDLSHLHRALYFFVSFGTGIIGSGVAGSKLANWLNYNDKPLDALGAVIISAVAIKLLTFVSEKMEDPTSLFSRFRGGTNGK
ncbi:MAG: phage holin family protein [Hafnia alvei]